MNFFHSFQLRTKGVLITLTSLAILFSYGDTEFAFRSSTPDPIWGFVVGKTPRRKFIPSSDGQKSSFPPVGALYSLTLPIPILGKQNFELNILDKGRAVLKVIGVLKINDTINFDIDPTSGRLQFALSDETQRTLKQFRTRLLRATYDGASDTPIIHVKPPLPMRIRLVLNRVRK